MAAIQFARHVDELCGTHLPVSFVLDHSHSLQSVVDKVAPQTCCHMYRRRALIIICHRVQGLLGLLKVVSLLA